MSPEAYLGEIAIFAGTSLTDPNWLPCDGRLLQVSEYGMLYALIGNTYGGVNNVSFNLPDLRGRTPVGMGQAASGTNYVFAQAGGSATATISMSQLPQHSHGLVNMTGGVIMASSHEGTTEVPDGTYNTIAAATDPNGSTNLVYNGATPDVPWNTGNAAPSLSVAGTGKPFSVMQTYMPLNFFICVFGNFPSPA